MDADAAVHADEKDVSKRTAKIRALQAKEYYAKRAEAKKLESEVKIEENAEEKDERDAQARMEHEQA